MTILETDVRHARKRHQRTLINEGPFDIEEVAILKSPPSMNSNIERSVGWKGQSWDGQSMPLLTVFIGRPPKVNQREIVEVAHALFAKYGYHGTTIRMITEAAAIPIGTLYYWFRSKQLLYGTCLEFAARAFRNSPPLPNEKSLVFDALTERMRFCVITQKVLTRLFQSMSEVATRRSERRHLERTIKALLRCRSKEYWNWYREYGAYLHKQKD